MLKTTILCVLCVTCAGASVRASAPEWLRNAEVYNGWYQKWDDASIAKMRGLPLVAGVPLDKAVIDKAHALGVRVIGYVTFYQMPPGQVYQNEELAEHPDWNVILADGSECKSIFEGTENTGWKTMCPNSPSYRKAALAYVKFMMDMGIDGLFVDNAHPDPACEGPKFGRHKHIYPGSGLDRPYGELLKAVLGLVRSYGQDKIVLANTCAPRPEWLIGCDGQMTESYIFSWAWEGGNLDDRKLLETQKRWAPLVDQGGVVVALSYLGHTKNPKRDDAFYSYAWARLSGFLWADWFTGWPDTAVLYKLRLGKPLGPMEVGEGCYTRRFERGMVAASAQDRSASLTISGQKRVFDVFNARHLKPDASGRIVIQLAPAQGRAYLFD